MDGFLNINKPQGLLSRSVVDQVNRLLRECGFTPRTMPKVGHAGTLDPLATGVLVVCIGHATRLIDLVQSRSKTYRGTFLLGRRSDTDDVAGHVVEGDPTRASTVTRAELDTTLDQFRGRIEQVPPAYSAVRVAGRRAHKLARRGLEVELQAKMVEIHRLDVVEFAPPELTLDIECSSGTYIRSLGRDLGERLGCGAVMSSLLRTKIGPFDLSKSVSISNMTAESLKASLLPCYYAASHLPSYCCDESEAERLSFGLGIIPRAEAWQPLTSGHPSEFSLIDSKRTLLAIGGWDLRSPELRPRINFVATYRKKDAKCGDDFSPEQA